MTKQSIFGRISQLAKANINALLDPAEDPKLMLDQMVHDYTNSIADAESAIAETIGNLRLLRRTTREDLREATVGQQGPRRQPQGGRAAGGGTPGRGQVRQPREGGARRQLAPRRKRGPPEPQIASQTPVVEQLKNGLNGMKSKLGSWPPSATSSSPVRSPRGADEGEDAVKSIDIMDPTSEVSRFEDKIRREEAKVGGRRNSRSRASMRSSSSWRPRTNRWSWTRGWRL